MIETPVAALCRGGGYICRRRLSHNNVPMRPAVYALAGSIVNALMNEHGSPPPSLAVVPVVAAHHLLCIYIVASNANPLFLTVYYWQWPLSCWADRAFAPGLPLMRAAQQRWLRRSS
jgi:hypothetical protein